VAEPIPTQDAETVAREFVRKIVICASPQFLHLVRQLPSVIGLPEGPKLFLIFIYTLYNECLRKGCFPKKWKKVKIIPTTKPGKENSTEVSKFRPISLINVGGKFLEKMLINRIMHHVHTNNLMNQN
jgi:hypothetical protein